MKICKNNKNIQLNPLVLCPQCAFRNKTCYWRKMFLYRYGICGGIVCDDILPNIFKL